MIYLHKTYFYRKYEEFETCVWNEWLIVDFAQLGYSYINVETRGERKNIGLITLNRPKALNALCDGLMTEVSKAIDGFESNQNIAAIVVTGSEKAFAGLHSSNSVFLIIIIINW